MLDNAFKGYHTCLFAYGQTGSGKSYSIVGYDRNIGIIPMVCADLYRRIDEADADKVEHQISISMLEIYNEQV